MKVLLAIPSSMQFGSQNTNGLALATRDIAFEVQKAYSDVEFGVIGDFADREDWYTAHHLDLINYRLHQKYLFDSIIEVAKDYDLIHLQANQYMTSRAWKVIEKTDTPVAISFCSPWISGRTTFLYQEEFMETYKGAHMSFYSPEVHKSMCNEYKVDPADMPYTLVRDVLVPGQLELEKEDYIAIVGRVDPMKNPWGTLKAAIKDARQHGLKIKYVGNTKLLVANKSTQSIIDDVMKIVQDNSDIIEHINECSHEEVFKILSKARALYHFANHENACRVVAEANSVGTPVVGFAEQLPLIDQQLNCLVPQSTNLNNESFFHRVSGVYPSDLRASFDRLYSPAVAVQSWYDFYKSAIKVN